MTIPIGEPLTVLGNSLRRVGLTSYADALESQSSLLKKLAEVLTWADGFIDGVIERQGGVKHPQQSEYQHFAKKTLAAYHQAMGKEE